MESPQTSALVADSSQMITVTTPQGARVNEMRGTPLWKLNVREQIAKKLNVQLKYVEVGWYLKLETYEQLDFLVKEPNKYKMVAIIKGLPNLEEEIAEKKNEIAELKLKLETRIFSKAQAKEMLNEITEVFSNTEQCGDMEEVCRITMEWLRKITPQLGLPERIATSMTELADRILVRIQNRNPPGQPKDVVDYANELKKHQEQIADLLLLKDQVNSLSLNGQKKQQATDDQIAALNTKVQELQDKNSEYIAENKKLTDSNAEKDKEIGRLRHNSANYRNKFESHSLRNLWQTFLYTVICRAMSGEGVTNTSTAGELLTVIQQRSEEYTKFANESVAHPLPNFADLSATAKAAITKGNKNVHSSTMDDMFRAAYATKNPVYPIIWDYLGWKWADKVKMIANDATK